MRTAARRCPEPCAGSGGTAGRPFAAALATPVLVALCALALGPHAARAQDSRNPPARYEFDAELRLLAQTRSDAPPSSERLDGFGSSRLRLSFGAQPGKHVRFFAQGQDSRVRWLAPGRSDRPHRNSFDLRQAYVNLGSSDSPVTLSAGRRELDFLGRRLLGLRLWSNISPTWDGSMLTLRRGADSVRLLAFTQVDAVAGLDIPSRTRFVHGLIGSIGSWADNQTVEPFVLTTRRPREFGSNLGGLLRTLGSRFSGEFRKAWEYEVLVATQWGGERDYPQRAWMGHWGASRALGDLPSRPKLVLEWSYSSGDADPADGRNGTFDPLFPARHALYGEHDLVGLRNLRSLRTGFEMHPRGDLRFNFDFYDFRLASLRDGLYGTNARPWFAAPSGGAASGYVGAELDLVARYEPTSRLGLRLSVSRFFAGDSVTRDLPLDEPRTFLSAMLTLRL